MRTANTLYFVRTGDGFDLYCSDQTGSIAHKLNDGDARIELSSEPSKLELIGLKGSDLGEEEAGQAQAGMESYFDSLEQFLQG